MLDVNRYAGRFCEYYQNKMVGAHTALSKKCCVVLFIFSSCLIVFFYLSGIFQPVTSTSTLENILTHFGLVTTAS